MSDMVRSGLLSQSHSLTLLGDIGMEERRRRRKRKENRERERGQEGKERTKRRTQAGLIQTTLTKLQPRHQPSTDKPKKQTAGT